MALLALKKQRWWHSYYCETIWVNIGSSLLMKRWIGVGRGRRSTANNVPLSLLRLGCHTLLWSLLTHRRPMSRTISPGLPFIGCCASSDRSSLLNDNRQQLHSHACTLAHTQTSLRAVLYCRKTNTFPTSLLAFSLALFLFRKEDKYPRNRKSLPLMHFQQSTASIHVFTYESEFILCPLQPDLFWMVNEKISGAIVAIFLRLASPAHLPMKFLRATWRGGGRLYSRAGWFVCPASAPQWTEQFINCGPVRMKDPYNTIQRWGEGIRREAGILFTQGVRVDSLLQECAKRWKCRQYAKPSSEPRLDFMGP